MNSSKKDAKEWVNNQALATVGLFMFFVFMAWTVYDTVTKKDPYLPLLLLLLGYVVYEIAVVFYRKTSSRSK